MVVSLFFSKRTDQAELPNTVEFLTRIMGNRKTTMVKLARLAFWIMLTVTPIFSTAATRGHALHLPRNETLYIVLYPNLKIQTFNPLANTGNLTFPVSGDDTGSILVYETLFMYNMLTGKNEPLLARKIEWRNRQTVAISLNQNAHFSDGHPLNAHDVVYTYDLAKKYKLSWSFYWQYLDAVVAETDYTVLLKLSKTNYNRLLISDSLIDVRILPMHIWKQIESDAGGDINKMRKYPNENPIGSGPYLLYAFDQSSGVTCIRDDNYWGLSIFGKLPAPKYIHHSVYQNNEASKQALKAGLVDFTQSFIPDVQDLWQDGTPIRTYLKEPPYYIPGVMPYAAVNVHKKGLDRREVRKALALAVDHRKIGQEAMSGYSEGFVPGIILNTKVEKRYVDQRSADRLRIRANLSAVNVLLDRIGAKRGPDGIRRLPDGTRLGPYRIECPDGWSDWNKAAEILAESARKVGIDIQLNFGSYEQWMTDRSVGNFDLLITFDRRSLTTSQPWLRSRSMMYSKGVAPLGEPAFWNFGRYQNAEADKLIDLIPQVATKFELKNLYTRLNEIFLTDLPVIQLMYRPVHFFTVNESVWTGFPEEGDGTNIPPQIPTFGAGVRILYRIRNR